MIYCCKPEQAKEKLQQTAEDGVRIVSLLSDKEAVQELPEIAVLKNTFRNKSKQGIRD